MLYQSRKRIYIRSGGLFVEQSSYILNILDLLYKLLRKIQLMQNVYFVLFVVFYHIYNLLPFELLCLTVEYRIV